MPKKQRGSDLNGSSFFNSRVFTQALDPSVKRYAKLSAFWRVAPSVRLSFFAILPAPVFLRASVFRVRTSAVVQERRLLLFIRFVQLGRTIRALAGAIGN